MVDKPMGGPSEPAIWLVIGDKLGDNTQVQRIAGAMPWPAAVRRVIPKPRFVLGKPRFRPSLYHLDLARSDALEPPWPDLILTVGRRPSMAALWVKAQSGGRTKVVIIGRPRRQIDDFDLVVGTGQFLLPDRDNVIHLSLPLMTPDRAAIAKAAAAWQPRFAALPRPLTAVLVGGPTKPFSFTASTARDLLRKARQAAAGGTLYLTTSRRTPDDVVAAFRSALPADARLFCWQPDAADNPYLGLLGLADRFVVTGDSISMMVEVARLGKPLAIFPLPVGRPLQHRIKQKLAAWLLPRGPERDGLLGALGRLLYEHGIVTFARDLADLHRQLIADGHAVLLGDPIPARSTPAPDQLKLVVDRLVRLLADGTATPPKPGGR